MGFYVIFDCNQPGTLQFKHDSVRINLLAVFLGHSYYQELFLQRPEASLLYCPLRVSGLEFYAVVTQHVQGLL